MIQKILFISLLILSTAVTYSQESFKKSLEIISKDLCFKMAEKGKKKIVVLFVTDINKTQTTAGKYMADVVSFYIVNNQDVFSVFDRENLSGIAEAKKLIAEGYIDANNAKQLGKILSVEAIVVGNYTVLSESLSLTIKALDVNDGFVIAQSLNELPIDNDAATLLGISPLSGHLTSSSISNKGFNNQLLNSNESYNNPTTVDKNCETNNKGDYCFQNNTRFLINVFLSGLSCTLKPGEVQCFYNANVGAFNYSLLAYKNGYQMGYEYEAKGQVLIEQCKSKTFVIK